MIKEGLFDKIHFIKIYDYNYINAGDVYCSPFLWFADFFGKYSCISHSLSSVRYELISKKDIVIIGGGGLFNYNPWFNFNEAINKILSICDNVIVWGAGFNTRIIDGGMEDYSPLVDFNRFRLYGIRDYNFFDYKYVPCPSCMNPLIKQAKETEPSVKLGSMIHPLMDPVNLPIEMDNCSHFNNINTIFDFIAKHEIIITNSYHCAYWAMLAGRRVVSPMYLLDCNKFSYMEAKPAFVGNWENKELLEAAINNAVIYDDYLEKCVDRTLDFFEEVKSVIIKEIPFPNKSYEMFYTQNMIAEYNWKLSK